eukprot:TRINITY_DN1604_c0_g1_i3.p2 TRINITY_DN1604_c0_g1~~TRINITY_DN1604_c0_g1_i3.p2  ORF type:complete len:122 (+),score=19.34 TRINITY_DN1604_c0_g1_i3:103-468(+)
MDEGKGKPAADIQEDTGLDWWASAKLKNFTELDWTCRHCSIMRTLRKGPCAKEYVAAYECYANTPDSKRLWRCQRAYEAKQTCVDAHKKWYFYNFPIPLPFEPPLKLTVDDIDLENEEEIC